MSSYKSYAPRRTTEPAAPSSTDKLRDKAEKLQELFPNWSNEDLHSVLVETAGDVELAVSRISEGHAEQWGSVTRKKEKKNMQPSQSTSSVSTRGDRDRLAGDSRGGRGGRGTRGRGGGGKGASRGAHTTHHHRDTGASVAGANGGTVQTATSSKEWAVDAGAVASDKDWSSEPNANGAGTGDSWGAKSTATDLNEPTGEGSSAPTSTAPVLGDGALTETSRAPTWTADTGTADSWASTSPAQNGTTDHAKLKAPVRTSKIPPGAKLSWAQIARVQEKPKLTPPPLTGQPTAPPAAPVISESQPPPITDEPIRATEQQAGREEPTTVQPPPWDDEPSNLPHQPTETQPQSHDGWITAENVPSHPPVQEAWDTSASFSAPQDTPQDPHWRKVQPEESVSLPSPQTTTPSISSFGPSTSASITATSTAPTSKPSTPSVTAATARPVNTHKASARYPKSDQAVVIPAFAGNIGAGGEKLGMQFGSLSIGSEDNLDGPFKPDADQATPPTLPEQQHPAQSQQTQGTTQAQSQDIIQSPVVPSTHSQAFFQQQPPAPVPQVHTPPQPAQPAPQPAPSGPPFGSQQHPQSLSHQQQHQLAHQHQQHSYVQQQQQQHSIHAHFEGPPGSQQQQQPQQQHVSGPQSSSYFRQPESPYYHNPTPPQSAAPEHQGAYATTFSPLGVGAGAHTHAPGLSVGQGQAGHLGGFGAGGPGEYGYGDGQRGFYDYAQPGSFSNRLVHDEPTKGGLPISQPNQPTSSLGSAAGQPQGASGPPGSSAQPPAGQQGQQQGYPAPMPYYYPPYYPQNSYPTYPNPSYGQAYMPKYPPVYPHQGPVGPGSAPPPTGKGPSGTAPYSASTSQNHLYHAQGGFEDPNIGYQHHQSSTNIGGGDYQKQQAHHQQQPLYGSQAAQGLQSFLGIQQAAGAGQGVSGPGGQQRSNSSPETAYKPYGAPGGAADKGGVGIGAQPGQQGRAAGVQQSQQQAGATSSFYPGGRFTGGTSGPQQQGQQQGQGYPQGGDQGQFYPYQPRHQGGYWQ